MCLALNDHESVELVMYGRPLVGWDINVVMDYLQAAYEVRNILETSLMMTQHRVFYLCIILLYRARSSTKSRCRHGSRLTTTG